MIIILKALNYISSSGGGFTLYIEEPEAHLFPTAQKRIVELLARTFNSKNRNLQIFITTHSPYVLTAINNLIFAYDVMKNKGEDLVSEIISKNLTINFDDVAAYTIENGILTSIVDEEFSIIDSDELDKASSHASDIYNQLLEFEPQD